MTHAAGAGRASRKALVGWCFYDWANSAFPTIVETFVFSTYFAKAVAPDIETGTAQWGYALALAGIFIFDVPTLEEATALTREDPAVKAGRFTTEVLPWHGPAGLTYDGASPRPAAPPQGLERRPPD